MIPPQTSPQTKTCRAQATLTAQETRYLNALPDADFTADAHPLGCDFAAHPRETRHAACAQMQYTGAGELVLWWLLWGEDGHREIRTAPGCRRHVVDETCLLIEDHPGACDQDCGWSREELKKAWEATMPPRA
ncbi:MAG TPA: hypothetical protein VN520_08125 [Streptomyces sp.]|uniref:hypothetical protein n=1 Tax=Streptomyces sp. TaxID=1931 RepID=UPI002CC27D75|nr:hypothetical protein [Streptomyces sp.]HWU06338.1 hypothetical protein [Streptomyces sp.]